MKLKDYSKSIRGVRQYNVSSPFNSTRLLFFIADFLDIMKKVGNVFAVLNRLQSCTHCSITYAF